MGRGSPREESKDVPHRGSRAGESRPRKGVASERGCHGGSQPLEIRATGGRDTCHGRVAAAKGCLIGGAMLEEASSGTTKEVGG